MPAVVAMSFGQMTAAASPAFSMYPGLTHGAYAGIHANASEELKDKYLPKLATAEWGGTMNLTEPQCGTDLGLIRTKAVPVGDGSYKISGQKIWISSGEHDFTDNIIHLVLARIEGAPQGVKGISLFVVPKFMVGDDGSIGARNGVECVGLEHKMGIHGNATCVMQYEDAVGWLVGEENAGWSYAKFLLGNERTGVARVGQTKMALARAKKLAGQTKAAGGSLLDEPLFAARLAELENELLALELTQLRVVASSADGRPNPASSLLKLRGSELQQAATEILADIAGTNSLAVAPPDPAAANGTADIAAPPWAQQAVPTYLNYRKVSIYSGSSEVQRQIIDKAVLGL